MNLLVLIAKIILLIAKGLCAMEAVGRVAAASGADFSELWERLPDKYK